MSAADPHARILDSGDTPKPDARGMHDLVGMRYASRGLRPFEKTCRRPVERKGVISSAAFVGAEPVWTHGGYGGLHRLMGGLGVFCRGVPARVSTHRPVSAAVDPWALGGGMRPEAPSETIERPRKGRIRIGGAKRQQQNDTPMPVSGVAGRDRSSRSHCSAQARPRYAVAVQREKNSTSPDSPGRRVRAWTPPGAAAQ